MDVDKSAGRDARRTKWSIAVFLVVTGAGILYLTNGEGSRTTADILLCLFSVVVGIGLVLHRPEARWLALGLCFLFVVGAILVPLLMFLVRPFHGVDGPFVRNMICTAFMLAFGGIGYRGLMYYRSELGRYEYRRDRDSDAVPPPDSSAHILYSAGVWLVLLGVLLSRGLNAPLWLLQPLPGDGNALMPAPRVEELVEAPVPVPKGSPMIVSHGLCRSGDSLVVLAYEYRGPPTRVTEFDVVTNGSWWDEGSRSTRPAKLPPPGVVDLVALGQIGTFANPDDLQVYQVTIDIDPRHRVDAADNHESYPISWQTMAELPTCVSLRTPGKS